MVGFNEKKKKFNPKKAVAPNEIDAYLLLAEVLQRRFAKPELADEVMTQLITANPDSSEAHYRYGRYAWKQLRSGRGDWEKEGAARAVEEFQRSLELKPGDPDVILALTDIAISRGTVTRGKDDEQAAKYFEEAKALIDQGLKDHPKNGEMYRARGSWALAQGEIDEAIEHVMTGLENVPTSTTLMVFLADLNLMKGNSAGLREAVKRLKEASFNRQDYVDFYDAQAYVLDGNWRLAAKAFETLRPRAAGQQDMIWQINMGLGRCYENLGQPDRQAEAFQRVLDQTPRSIPAREGRARALIALGKVKEGTEELKKVARELDNRKVEDPRLRANLLQIALSDQMKKPADDRNWDEVDGIVEKMLENKNMTDVQRARMRIEIYLVKDDLDEAKALANRLVKENPKDVSSWISWLSVGERVAGEKFSEQAQDVKELEARKKVFEEAAHAALDRLAYAEKSAGDQVAFRVARANILSRIPGDDVKEKIAAFEQDIDKFSPDDQARLWEGLGNVYQRLADFPNVKRCFMKLVERKPDELYPWENMFDLALAYPQDEEVQKTARAAAERIRDLAGATSASYKYCVASQLIAQVIRDQSKVQNTEKAKTLSAQKIAETNQQDHKKLADASKLVDDAMCARHDWHQLYRLAGEIDDMEGRIDSAIANYQRAEELGSTNANTARRLVLLLWQRGRMQDVQAAIKHVGRGNSTQLLDRINIASKFNVGEQDAALEGAAQAVEARPDDLESRVWYANMLEKARQPAKAEEQYRIALKSLPKNDGLWLALIRQLVVQQKQAEQEEKKLSGEKKDQEATEAREKAEKKKAEAVAALEESKKSVPEEKQDAMLVQAYEDLGQLDEAEKYQLKILGKDKDNLALRQGVALFYMRHGATDQKMAEKARAQIEKIMASPVEGDEQRALAYRAWARRALAGILARQGNYADIEKAIKLVGENSVNGRPNPDDLRFIARILADRPDSGSRERAIRLFEQLGQALFPQERVALAVLYDRAGKWSKAKETMMEVVAKSSGDPRLLGRFIAMLLQHNEVSSIDPLMDKLQEIAPDSPITAQLKTRWLSHQGKTEEAVAFLETLIPDPATPEDGSKLLGVSSMLEEMKQYDVAEKYMRQWYAMVPEQIVSYAAFLGRAGKVDESLALFKKALATKDFATVAPAIYLTLRLNDDKVTPKQMKTVEQWLRAALKKDPDSIAMQLLLVDYQDLNGRFKDSIAKYRELLARKDLRAEDRAKVQNNLAFLLATSGSAADMAEAEKLVEGAISHFGPIGSVLDTRGMVRLAAGDTKQALDDFKTAVAEVPSAVNYFHMSLAEEKLGNSTGMDEAFHKAKQLKLDTKLLSPMEQASYKRLEEALAKTGKG